jgi:hypothetical protein
LIVQLLFLAILRWMDTNNHSSNSGIPSTLPNQRRNSLGRRPSFDVAVGYQTASIETQEAIQARQAGRNPPMHGDVSASIADLGKIINARHFYCASCSDRGSYASTSTNYHISIWYILSSNLFIRVDAY